MQSLKKQLFDDLNQNLKQIFQLIKYTERLMFIILGWVLILFKDFSSFGFD